MKLSTSTLATLAAISLLGASTAAAHAHTKPHSRAHHSHKHSIANSSFQAIARLPAASVRIALHGQNDYTVGGKYYLRVNKGWRMVAAPANRRAAQQTRARKRSK